MPLNVNSLLTKIDQLHNIVKFSNIAVTGITETKLDTTVYDSEVAVDNYNVIRNDKKRKGVVATCCIRNNIYYNIKNWQHKERFRWSFVFKSKSYIGGYYMQISKTNPLLRTNDYRSSNIRL